MIDLLSKLKIPTLLGLGIILIGIVVGVFMVLQQKTFLSFATPDATAIDIEKTNITDTSISISFTTNVSTSSFIKYGPNPAMEEVANDIRDTSEAPKERTVHYFVLKNLSPDTEYNFVIQTGKNTSTPDTFSTAAKETLQNGYAAITGVVLNKKTPLKEGIVYLSMSSAIKQSALIKSGNFIIPISYLRKSDLSDVYIPDKSDTSILTVTPPPPGRKEDISIVIDVYDNQIPPIILDKTAQDQNPLEINYDVTGDNSVNIFDFSKVLSNIGKSAKDNPLSDLDRNGKIDKGDLDLIIKRLQSGGG